MWSVEKVMCNITLKTKLFLDITSLFMSEVFKKDPMFEDFSTHETGKYI